MDWPQCSHTQLQSSLRVPRTPLSNFDLRATSSCSITEGEVTFSGAWGNMQSKEWNPGSHICKASALPLSHISGPCTTLVAVLSLPMVVHRLCLWVLTEWVGAPWYLHKLLTRGPTSGHDTHLHFFLIVVLIGCFASFYAIQVAPTMARLVAGKQLQCWGWQTTELPGLRSLHVPGKDLNS